MANTISTKIGANAVSRIQSGAQTDSAKLSASKFDKIRSELQAQTATVKLPPAVSGISAQQKKALDSDLRRRLDQTNARTPKEFFKPELTATKNGIEKVSRSIEAMPASKSLDPLRKRLQDVEDQFKASGKAIDGLGKMDDPQSLLKLQVQLYQVSQNVAIVSRVVDQMSSGVKSILQTQV